MHFVEVEFFRRGDADQQREMRENEKIAATMAVRIIEPGGTEGNEEMDSRTICSESGAR